MLPRSIDASPAGVVALLSGDGRRLVLGDAEFELPGEATHLAFFDEVLGVLYADGALRSIDSAGKKVGKLRGPPGALDLAVTPGGSVLLSYPDRLVRLGAREERFGFSGGALAVESGGIWIAGDDRAVRLRPVKGGYKTLREIELPAPARAATIGPDGSLYLLLEPGDRLLGTRLLDLDQELGDLTRGPGKLLGAGAGGVVDLTALCPAPGEGPQFELPSCSD